MKNVIILTYGRTGSSILAGLISQIGYYINIDLVQPRKFYPVGDCENPDLIALNESILEKAGYQYGPQMLNKKVDLARIESLAKSDTIGKYQEFLERCEKKRPWLWKDPRLVFTIFLWKEFLDLKNVHFIFLTRDADEVFRSICKLKIRHSKREIYDSYLYRTSIIEQFICDNNIEALHLDYSELWNLESLNEKLRQFVGIRITDRDYKKVVTKVRKRKEPDVLFWARYFYSMARFGLMKFL